MPTKEARIKVKRWDHDEWIALPIDCQWLYDTIRSQVLTNHAGVGQIPRRMWANLAGDDDAADRIAAAMKILIDRRFVLIDDDTDEVLIRSYIRHDILDGPPGVFVAAMTAATTTRSPALRAALHAELLRMDRAAIEAKAKGMATERPGAAFQRAVAALDPNPSPPGRADDDPREPAPEPDADAQADRPERPIRPVDEHAMAHAMRHAMTHAMDHATGDGDGDGASLSVGGYVGSAPRADDHPQPDEPPTLPGLLVALPALPATPPRCRVHAKLPDDVEPGPCPGCKRSRERWERDIAERRALDADTARQVRAGCDDPDCDDGWVEVPPATPLGQARTSRCPTCNPPPTARPRAV